MRNRYKGCEKIDGYLIPKKEVGAYKRNRKRARKLLLQAMESVCYRACTAFRGSEDGEAVLGLNKQGEIMAIIHLSPGDVDAILKAHEEGTLVEWIA